MCFPQKGLQNDYIKVESLASELAVYGIPSMEVKGNSTVDPVYSGLGYSEYPLIVNGFLRTDR